jgi:2-hydroxychromene-2-carboxylate isomerase
MPPPKGRREFLDLSSRASAAEIAEADLHIETAAAEIRASWTAEQRRARSVGGHGLPEEIVFEPIDFGSLTGRRV